MSELIYRVADQKWDMKSRLGNHRIIVDAPAGEYVKVTIPWRRRDLDPQSIGIKIAYGERENGAGRNFVNNIFIEKCERFKGVIIFEAPIEGEYEVYYMPYTMPGDWYFPIVDYMKPEEMSPDAGWLEGIGSADCKIANAVAYEARVAFDSFYPMEIPMNSCEAEKFIEGDEPFKVLAESRLNSVRMKFELPTMWLDRSELLCLNDIACKNEHYVFQVVVIAKEDLCDLKVRFFDKIGNEFPIDKVICFNTDGVDTYGKPMVLHPNVNKGSIQPMWCGVKLEEFEGESLDIVARVSASNVEYTSSVNIHLDINDEILPDNGDCDLWRLSRLFWLNSDHGISNEVLKPYIPVEYSDEDNTVSILGRKFAVGELGLPCQITSFYDDCCELSDEVEPLSILAKPIALNITQNDTKKSVCMLESKWVQDGTQQGSVISRAKAGDLELESHVTYEADGHIDCMINIKALKTDKYSFDLNVTMSNIAARYMMGMCREGGDIPSYVEYNWNESDGNSVWFGGTRAGVQIKPMQEYEHWRGAYPHPKLWYNDGKGKMKLHRDQNKGITAFDAVTGELVLEEGQSEILHFHMIVTPFHPIDYKTHWTEHYYHKNSWNSNEPIPNLDNAVKYGASIVILHQGGPLNENINYPFVVAPKLKEEVTKAHNMGLRYKIYYTVRELSNYTAEIWALRSLGDEIYKTGKMNIADFFEATKKQRSNKAGGPWLVEHLVEGCAPAWHQYLQDGEYDCAIGTQNKSRWHNYYIKGLDWLIRNVGIDGLYLDGMGYDRHTMRRMRRTLDNAKDGCNIDIHNGNEHAPHYGLGISSSIYLEHFPYADSLWNGEGFDCENSSPDNFLTEMCGIPFGLMGEMLEKGGNPHRGMLYGMTARCGWSQGGVSYPIWKVWNEFGITESKMLGYWHPDCPVSTENEQIKATAYVKPNGEAMICVASWFGYDKEFRIFLNKEALGITGECEFYAPAIEGVQEEASFDVDGYVPFSPRKGWIFLLRKK